MSRAAWPGSRVLLVATVVIAAAAALAAYVVVTGSSTPSGKYGQLPSWLPKATIPVNRVVTASAARPWLAVQGDEVSVRLARGRALATTVGPSVPEEGRFPVPETTLCTFTVTLRATAGSVPVSRRSFSILDEHGHTHRPEVTRAGGGALPTRIVSGQTLTLTVKDVLPTGDGHLRWAPAGGAPIVAWDFNVEID